MHLGFRVFGLRPPFFWGGFRDQGFEFRVKSQACCKKGIRVSGFRTYVGLRVEVYLQAAPPFSA